MKRERTRAEGDERERTRWKGGGPWQKEMKGGGPGQETECSGGRGGGMVIDIEKEDEESEPGQVGGRME